MGGYVVCLTRDYPIPVSGRPAPPRGLVPPSGIVFPTRPATMRRRLGGISCWQAEMLTAAEHPDREQAIASRVASLLHMESPFFCWGEGGEVYGYG